MRLIDDHTGLVIIDRKECLQLLAHERLGRVAVVPDGVRPTVLPVNYVLDGESIVFRTAPGSKLTSALRNGHVAFEIDGADPMAHTGWSVIVTGHAEEVTETDELERMNGLPLRPWAEGEKSHFIRIPTTEVSGRRIVHVVR
jgi:nitroimidazol reductase NimA-like FMN-containing flavoprotein (pyridoxamine 5'-phosphate oxidase superfamily)